MAFRTVAQVAAGFLAGAVLVGAPTWAVASQDDEAPSTDMSQMMSDEKMMTSMSKMMKEPAMREDMASMMSDMMSEMPGMGGDGSDHGMSGMHGTGTPDASPGDPKP